MDAIKVGIIGIGRAGWGMHRSELAGRKDKFEIVAACDIEQERVDKMVVDLDCKGYVDIDEFLNDSDMELVSIATRSPEHTEHALKAIAAGKIVFLEKPIALTLADAERLAATAKENPGKLYFRHNRRFEPAFQHIREIIASGVLGDVYEIKLHRHGYQRRQDWQTLIDCGGGQLNNWGPHIIDHALQFLESPVADMWSDLKKVAAVGDAEDHVNVTLKGENGRVVNLEISGGASMGQPTYVVFANRGMLTCDEKDVRLNYLDPEFLPAECHAIPESPPLTGSFGNTEKLQWLRKTIMVKPAKKCDAASIWDHLYAAIREDVTFPITTEEAVEVVRVVENVKKGTEFDRS